MNLPFNADKGLKNIDKKRKVIYNKKSRRSYL